MSAPGQGPAGQADTSGPGRPRPRPISLLTAGFSQFSGQALGILIAVLVSHLIARRLGVGPEADAFLLGRRLVTSLSEVLNQVVVVVFIPLIAARAAAGHGVGKILGHAGGAALALGLALAGGLALCAPAIVAILAPDFDPGTADLARRVVMILAMALPAAVATIAFAAYCNVKGRFGMPAAIRQAPRAAVAAALLLGSGALALQAAAAYTIAFWAVAALTLIVAFGLRGDGDGTPSAQASASAVGRRGGAAILLTLGALASIWLETAFAARQGVGAVAMLDFSQRLGALCGNTLAMALALVTFADLSRRAAAGETEDLGARFGKATLTAIALLLPLQLVFLVNAGAVVDLIIAHGEMSADAVARVTELLRWMAVAPLGALITRMLLMRVLAEHGLPIARLVGGAVVLDILVRLGLFTLLTPLLGLLAIPVALVFAPAAPIAFLAFWLRRRGAIVWKGLPDSARPILAASVLCSGAIVVGAALGPVLERILPAALGDLPKLGSLAQLAASGCLGLLALGAGIKVFGARFGPS